MSVIRTLNAIGAALAGVVNADGSDAPPADPRTVRDLLVEIGMLRAGAPEAEVVRALRRFQATRGWRADGVAGPKTCQALARRAREVRELREIGLAA